MLSNSHVAKALQEVAINQVVASARIKTHLKIRAINGSLHRNLKVSKSAHGSALNSLWSHLLHNAVLPILDSWLRNVISIIKCSGSSTSLLALMLLGALVKMTKQALSGAKLVLTELTLIVIPIKDNIGMSHRRSRTRQLRSR